MKDTLELKGFTITATTNPFEAIFNYNKAPEQYDLVITDVVMPAISGDKLIDELRKINPEINVLAVSAYTFNSIVNSCESQAIWFLSKPFEPSELLLKVQSIFDQN
jgi:CheY-like chemotaxis protein